VGEKKPVFCKLDPDKLSSQLLDSRSPVKSERRISFVLGRSSGVFPERRGDLGLRRRSHEEMMNHFFQSL
jgi:hypothetical protein